MEKLLKSYCRFNVVVSTLLITMFSINIYSQEKNLVDYIRPVIGTQGEGNVYPGPVAPHGMVQLGPDTDKMRYETASGYDYADTLNLGFSIQHLSGTGIPDLCDFPIIPSVGKMEFIPGVVEKKDEDGNIIKVYDPDSGYCTPFSHYDEVIKAGYYSVRLPEHNILVELTATERAGILKFTFPKSDSSNIMMDLNYVFWKVIWSLSLIHISEPTRPY